MQQLLIFTDLDGTLLDHHNYSYQAALPALLQLKRRQIPLIICTSKTAAEVTKLRHELEIDAPFIVENGTAIVFPHGDDYLFSSAPTTGISSPESAYFFGKNYRQLLETVHMLRERADYQFKGFADFTIAELADETGLELYEAKLAKQRLSSEPIRWDDSDLALLKFTEQLHAEGLQLLRGGRYYHVLSPFDKGTAVRWLLDKYRQASPESAFYSVGLGDGPNDKALLEAVDLGIIIPSASGQKLEPAGVMTRRMNAPGPDGWNQAITALLEESEQKFS